jgi:pimeloyl-ACP methyl ester carboxylesterase
VTVDDLPRAARALYPWTGKIHTHASGLRQHYLDEGSGPPLLMVHGNPTWSFTYRELVKAFSATHRCVVPDHIGAGLSDKPLDWPYQLEGHIDHLVALIEALDLHDVTVLVHDWGGATGLGAATRVPDRISRVIVLNTAVEFLGDAPLSIRVCSTSAGALLVRGLNAFIKGGLFMATNHRDAFRGGVAEGYLAPYPDWDSRIGQHRFIQDIPFKPDHPSYATLKGVRDGLEALRDRPKLLIWGEKDFVFTPAYRRAWEKRFPDTESHALDDAGHWVTEDARDTVISLVRSFLERTA